MCIFSLQPRRSLLATFIVATTDLALAASASASERFQISGEGTLHATRPILENSRFQLSATLAADAPAPYQAPDTLVGGRFALNAIASSNSLVCYNDTIFRDGFDGNGF